MHKMIKDFVNSQIERWIKPHIDYHLSKLLSQGYFDASIKNVILNQYLVYGNPTRLKLSPTCIVNNALFNLSSGDITIGDEVFFGHNVSLITGTHDYTKFGLERMKEFPTEGNDIVIEEGVWLASNVTVIGPCKIGKHSVVAAGAVVKGDISSYQVVAGIPARTIKEITP